MRKAIELDGVCCKNGGLLPCRFGKGGLVMPAAHCHHQHSLWGKCMMGKKDQDNCISQILRNNGGKREHVPLKFILQMSVYPRAPYSLFHLHLVCVSLCFHSGSASKTWDRVRRPGGCAKLLVP